MTLNTPTKTVLYTIDETIKAYRKLCTANITKVVSDITVDQALLLIILKENTLTQSEAADLIFKDYASMTRILNLMINKGYIEKTVDQQDRRRSNITITTKGKEAIKKLYPAVKKNRQTALKGISKSEQAQLFKTLSKICKNCKGSQL